MRLAAAIVWACLWGSAWAADVPVLSEARMGCVSLHVRNLPLLLNWYRDVLGFREETSWRSQALGNRRVVFLRLGDVRLAMAETDQNAPPAAPAASLAEHFSRPGYGHLGLVVSNLDVAMAELASRGAAAFAKAETQVLPGTAYERRMAMIQDPEGNVVELAEPLRLAGAPAPGGPAPR